MKFMEEQYETSCHVSTAWPLQGQMFRPLIGIDTLSRGRMYKTKLRAWGIRKYNLEQDMAALARTIEQRKGRGKASKVFKQGKPFAFKAKIDIHLRMKNMLEELIKSIVIDAPMPERFVCVNPSAKRRRYPFNK
jgi:hypothetical protein